MQNMRICANSLVQKHRCLKLSHFFHSFSRLFLWNYFSVEWHWFWDTFHCKISQKNAEKHTKFCKFAQIRCFKTIDVWFFNNFPHFFATVFVILLLCGVTLILGYISSAMSRRQISPLPGHLSTFHRICANAVVVPGHTSFIFWRHLATFFGAADLSIPRTCLNFWRKKVLLLRPSNFLLPAPNPYARTRKSIAKYLKKTRKNMQN